MRLLSKHVAVQIAVAVAGGHRVASMKSDLMEFFSSF